MHRPKNDLESAPKRLATGVKLHYAQPGKLSCSCTGKQHR
jgi:hypothetical protein